MLYSFPPIADSNAKLLILGSMPGQESLTAGQYYANRRNMFWKIMAELLGFDPNSPYETRLQKLKAAHIALWDVMQSCNRIGSLDSKIDTASITVNDFQQFFAKHSQIDAVFFNGIKAESTYRHCVLASVSRIPVSYTRLPSTSPAHASLSYELKFKAWQAVLKPEN